MHSSEGPFKDHWAKTLWPALRGDYERLSKVVPKRVAERAEKDKAEKEKKDKDKPDTKKAPKPKDPVRERLRRCVDEAIDKELGMDCTL